MNLMNKMDKKGINYIELIISFVLFASFLTVLFVYLNPIKQPTLSEVILDSVEQGLESNASIILYETPFKVSSGGVECFQNDTILKILIEKDHTKMFIEDDFGNVVNFFLGSDKLMVQKSPSSSMIYHIFYSNQTTFLFSSFDFPSCTEMQYNASISRFFTIYSYSGFEKINETYYTNYSSLKTRFDVPSINDFAIILTDENNLPIFQMEREIPKNLIVQSREFPVSILNENTKKRIKANLNIKVW